ncbi:cytochrome P450 [Saccharopolyspora rosea]|uniref:Cytochrome P450 n=1 Tax=Saccharopolyspora rosea TaxID=524884 RepID=A0ABW3G0X8_9PSEU|nr:cytochrome P450 [Saccharopolyspora rosea]
MTAQEIPEYAFANPRGDLLSPAYHSLRRRSPVARVVTATGEPAWYVTSYQHCLAVLRDPRFSLSQTHAAEGVPQRDEIRFPPIGANTMNRLSEAGLRDEFMRHVGPGQTAVPMDWVRSTAREQLDRMRMSGQPADLLSEWANPVIFAVARRLLGLPEADDEVFVEMVEKDLCMGDYSTADRLANLEHLQRYMRRYLDRPREEPAGMLDDLVDAQRRVLDSRGGADGLVPLTDDEFMDLAGFLLISAVANPAGLLTVGALVLLEHPEVARRLSEHPEEVPHAVEELLRSTVTMGGGLGRIATEDVELGGVTVRRGELVLVVTDAANHDPDVFAEPDRFDIDRERASTHLKFGGGRHYCPASHLSRAVAAAAFEVLLAEMPALRLAVPPTDLEWVPDRYVQLPRQLPVIW